MARVETEYEVQDIEIQILSDFDSVELRLSGWVYASYEECLRQSSNMCLVIMLRTAE